MIHTNKSKIQLPLLLY